MDQGLRSNLRPMDLKEAQALMEVCLGNEPPDILIKDVNLVNVYTHEIMERQDIAIKGRWIAYVGKPEANNEQAKIVMDGKGLFATPGLIDGHTHFAYIASPYEYLKHMIPTGVTTIVTEVMELYPLVGLDGLLEFFDSLKDQPIKILFTVPAMVTTPSDLKGMPRWDLEKILEMEDVLGLGESYWQSILQERDRYLPNLVLTRAKNKTLEGHTAGARDRGLMAYLSLGISSCHEPIRPEEVLSRVRLGLHVMIREGAVRKDLENIAPVFQILKDKRRLILASDGTHPEELLEHGYLDHLVRRAIELGLDPISAIQMTTLNVAEHFHLEHLIGGIGPSRLADVVLVEDLHTFKPKVVISSGQITYEGSIKVLPRKHQYSLKAKNSLDGSKSFSPDDFDLSSRLKPKDRVSIIAMVTDLVTREETIEIPDSGPQGWYRETMDLATVAAIDRRKGVNRASLGLVKGFGLREGAFGSSGAWDTTDIVIVGRDPSDMAMVANRIFQMQGGACIAVRGERLWEIPMPLYGVMADIELEEVAQKLKELREVVRELGVLFNDPLLSLVTLTTCAIPFFRICSEGYVDIKTGKAKGLLLTGL